MAGETGSEAEPDDADHGLVYLDSNVYLDYLIGDKDWSDALHGIFGAWRRGDLAVATSALTIAEVLYLPRAVGQTRRRLPPGEQPRVADLFSPAAPRRFTL